MKVTIFYSWQSDLPNSTNRGFIQRALEKAVQSIKAQEELVIEPCLERDTAGVSGTPDIASTIFRKIDESHVFVADLSVINPKIRNGRKTPNPNVLLELGYAAKTLTWDNVICVFNTAFGKTDDLPFDLRLRRMALYSVSEDQESKAEEREKLASILHAALQPILLRLNQQVHEDATPKPLTPQQASAKVKEYLADDRCRIPLGELVMDLGSSLAQQTVGPDFPAEITGRLTEEDIRQRIERYWEISQVTQAVMVAGCFFGTKAHQRLWIDLLQRVANPPGERNGRVVLLGLRRFPALLLLYSGGIAAVAAEHYDTLLALLTTPKVFDPYEPDQPLLCALSAHRVIDRDSFNKAMGQNRYAPLSEHLFSVLREPLRTLLPDDRQYQKCFDRFEYMKCLLEAAVTGDPQAIGSFGWRWKYRDQDVMKEIEEEEARLGASWPPYQVGWFQGQREQFVAAKDKVIGVVARLGWH